MSNPFEPSNQENSSAKPQWPAFPGVPEPEAPPQNQAPTPPQPPQGPVPPPPQGKPAFQTPGAPQGQPQNQPPFQQSYQPQVAQHSYQPQFTQQQQPYQGPKKTNILGLLGLGFAVLGTILACVKTVMALGWVLLPLGFILGIVALFMKDQGKASGIAAIAISIIGSVVAVGAAIYYVASELDTDLTGGKTVVAGGEDGDKKQGSSRENPLPIGSTIENKDWEITVNSVDLKADAKIKAANSYNDPPKPGNVQILVNMTYKYKGNKPEGEYLLTNVDFVTSSGNSISSHETPLVIPDSLLGHGTMYNGATATGNIAFEVPASDVEKGTLAVKPGFMGDKRFFAVK